MDPERINESIQNEAAFTVTDTHYIPYRFVNHAEEMSGDSQNLNIAMLPELRSTRPVSWSWAVDLTTTVPNSTMFYILGMGGHVGKWKETGAVHRPFQWPLLSRAHEGSGAACDMAWEARPHPSPRSIPYKGTT